MRMNELKRLNEAPESGTALIYLISEVKFQKYCGFEELEKIIGDEGILEMHLFDDQKEYRCIVLESQRFKDKDGVIEAVVDGEGVSEDGIFPDACVLDGKYRQDLGDVITVLNYISYDENGMAHINGYRLMMGRYER